MVFLKWVYTVFIGLLLATTVGVGIQAFYSPPKQPQPTIQPYPVLEGTNSAKMVSYQNSNNQAWQDYQVKSENYNKDVSVIASVFAIFFLVLSVTIIQKIILISDGILLGGLITELYSVFKGFMSGDDKVRFLVVSVGLVLALFLGYLKFVKGEKKRK